MKARVEDDGGRGVAVRFVARFGGDAALRVTWPRFGRWRTNERRRGVEVAIPWKNIWFVFACHATQAFSTKSCRLLWTRAKRRFCLFSLSLFIAASSLTSYHDHRQ